MQMDSRLILAGQSPDPLGNLSRGQTAANAFNIQKKEQAKRNFLTDYGQQLASGDEGALAAYAQHDLQGSMALKAHFDAKKAAAARAAAAANANAQKKQLEDVQLGLDNVARVRDWAKTQSDDPAVQDKIFKETVPTVLRPETVAKLTELKPDWGINDADVFGMRVAGQNPALKYTPYVAPEVETAVVKPGDSVVNKQTGEVLATIPKEAADNIAPEISKFNQAWKGAGKQLDTPEYQKAITEKFLTSADGSMPAAAIQVYEKYAAQETAAGRAPMGILEFQKTISSKGLKLTTNPDGSVELSMGGGDETDYGKTPTGYKTVKSKDENGNVVDVQVPIVGSPDWKKQTDILRKREATVESYESQSQLVMDTIDKALAQVNAMTAGPAGMGADIAVHPGHGLYQSLETIKANIALDTLKEMKEQSATGASGMGALSEKELAVIQSRKGSIAQTNSPQDLKDNLMALKADYARSSKLFRKVHDQELRDYGLGLGAKMVVPDATAIEAMSDEEFEAIGAAEIGQMDLPALNAYVARSEGGQ